jgi:D-alanine--poly(phosphoribitol) ligase subunit 2
MGGMKDSLVPDLHTLFSQTLNVDVPSADADLIESGLLDSLRLVELLLHIEASLGCRINLEEIDLDDLRSVNRIARMISARMELA